MLRKKMVRPIHPDILWNHMGTLLRVRSHWIWEEVSVSILFSFWPTLSTENKNVQGIFIIDEYLSAG